MEEIRVVKQASDGNDTKQAEDLGSHYAAETSSLGFSKHCTTTLLIFNLFSIHSVTLGYVFVSS